MQMPWQALYEIEIDTVEGAQCSSPNAAEGFVCTVKYRNLSRYFVCIVVPCHWDENYMLGGFPTVLVAMFFSLEGSGPYPRAQTDTAWMEFPGH